MAWHKKGRNHRKKRERRRWDGESTSGRAARIAARRRSHKSGRHGRRNPLRSWHYQSK